MEKPVLFDGIYWELSPGSTNTICEIAGGRVKYIGDREHYELKKDAKYLKSFEIAGKPPFVTDEMNSALFNVQVSIYPGKTQTPVEDWYEILRTIYQKFSILHYTIVRNGVEYEPPPY